MSKIIVHTGASNGYSFGQSYEAGSDAKVDPDSVENLNKWSFVLGISKTELVQAISKYGTTVKNIRKGLNSETAKDAA